MLFCVCFVCVFFVAAANTENARFFLHFVRIRTPHFVSGEEENLTLGPKIKIKNERNCLAQSLSAESGFLLARA